jgi:hypothetical protein
MGKKPDPAYIVDLGSRLLKAKAELKSLQAEWDALFHANSDPTQSSQQATSPRSETNVSRIIDFLGVRVGQAFTSDEVADALGLENKQSTATTLSKLVKQGRIRKQGADQYTAFDSALTSSSLGQTPNFNLTALGEDSDRKSA